jgi:ADP-L-glycero-D-manno-heptose 6-epimerase
MYGYSKQLFDLWARRTGLLKKITGLKYFNVFGPNEYHKADMRSFVLRAFEQIVAVGKVKLFRSHKSQYKDGQQLRDFIYVKDAVDMTLFFLDNPGIGGLFNIGTGIARTWNDLVTAVFTAMDKKPDIEYIDIPESKPNQNQNLTQPYKTKKKNAGYSKKINSLEDAVSDYVRHYLKNNGYLAGC